MTAYTPLTNEEKQAHLNMFNTTGTSGILASGEANFFDTNQSIGGSSELNNNNTIDLSKQNVIYSGGAINPDESTDNPSSISPSGLTFSSILSNGKLSKDYSINDFSIFNDYIHYIPRAKPIKDYNSLLNIEFSNYGFNVDTSSFLNKATVFFNIYSKDFRNQA